MAEEYKLSYTGAQIDEILKKAEGIKVPTKISELENDSGYANKSELEAMVVMTIDNPDTGETSTNYSSKEIHDAYRAGRTVLMNINGVLGYLTNITPNGGVVQFTFSHEDTKFVVAIDGNEVVNEIVYDTKLTPFIVTLDGSTNTTDKSVVEMYEVWTKGRQIYLDINGMLIPLTSFGDNMAVFTLCIEGAQILFTVDGNKVSKEVFEMALSEDIPTDEHINELIDAKVQSSGGNADYGEENAGKLLYVGADGYATVLALGAGLKIVNGVLTITSAVVTAAICGESTCGNTICGGA